MNWNHNITPFIPSMALNDDWSSYSITDLAELSMGSARKLQASLTDNSMANRYYKDDVVNFRMNPTEIPTAADGMILLPDNSVIFRCYTINEDTMTLTPFDAEAESPQCYPLSDITILGIPCGIIRVS
ncbi:MULTISPECIES: hypothetical protein [Eubacterium]|uniref:Uncharacterized protein n=1 Tax=Eubacterium barkeri TaxID=1528 RepID=A0A1H3E1Y6_EUBBA|nr:hypothetical protein [Eubacterium barkeri]SDX71939.1 hypothetical protein SAMN04488579_10639 [Eubacterium barkeri]